MFENENIKHSIFWIAILFSFTLVVVAVAGEERESLPEVKQKKSKKVNIETINLGIPSAGEKGSPEKKITVGAPRGGGSDLELSIYIPQDHIIRSSRPILKWRVSEPVNTPVKFTIVNDMETEPVFSRLISAPSDPGIHFLNLLDQRVSVSHGTIYEWSISICMDKSCKFIQNDLTVRTVFTYMN